MQGENHILMKIQSSYTKAIIEYKKSQITKCFPVLQNSKCENYVSLYKFITHIPECFYNEKVFSTYFDWLKTADVSQHEDLVKYFIEYENRLSSAIRNISQVNELKIHDEDLKGKDEYNLLEIIDNCIHPNYLKILEGVFSPLIHPVAYLSRVLRNSSVEKLDIFNSVEEIQIQCPNMEILVKPYIHIVRNGIAHGSVEYLNNEIKYTDKKGNSEILYSVDVITLFDELVDCCNAMVLALKIFFASQYKNEYKIPFALLIDELKTQNENKWLEINNCIQMTIQSKGTQLLVYALVKTTDVLKVHYFILQVASLSESLMPGYDRYFISLKSEHAYSGWCSFDGAKLKQARTTTTEEYVPFVNAIDDSGVFFHPKIKYPKLFYKFDNFVESFLIYFRITKKNLENEYKRSNILIKNYESHRSYFSTVLNADVVLIVNSEVDISKYIKSHYSKIVRYVSRHIIKYLPLGFARISVYSKQMRKRTYKHYGLGEDLICVIQYKKLQRIRCRNIFESIVEEHGLYRIEWNKKWLELHDAIETGDEKSKELL